MVQMRPTISLVGALALLGRIPVVGFIIFSIVFPHEGNAWAVGVMLAATAVAFSSSVSADSFSFRRFGKIVPIIILVSSECRITDLLLIISCYASLRSASQ